MIRRLIPQTALALVMALGLTGCNNKTKPAPEEPAPATQPEAMLVEPAPASSPPPASPTPAPAPKPIPAKKTAATTPPPAKATTSTTKAKAKEVYVVQQGDTLTAIAKRVYGDANKVKAIIAANPGLEPDKIKVGQKIVLP